MSQRQTGFQLVLGDSGHHRLALGDQVNDTAVYIIQTVAQFE
jgi:hypothetical protein